MKKVCTKCKIEKDVSEFRIINKDTGAREAKCKECIKEYYKAYYIKNKEKYKAKSKAQYQKNAEKWKKYSRDKYKEMKESQGYTQRSYCRSFTKDNKTITKCWVIKGLKKIVRFFKCEDVAQ